MHREIYFDCYLMLRNLYTRWVIVNLPRFEVSEISKNPSTLNPAYNINTEKEINLNLIVCTWMKR